MKKKIQWIICFTYFLPFFTVKKKVLRFKPIYNVSLHRQEVSFNIED